MFNQHNKKDLIMITFIILLMCTTLICINSHLEDNNAIKGIPIINPLFEDKRTTITTTTTIDREKVYDECINKRFSEEDITPEIKKIMNDIDDTIKNNNYDVSILYEDINIGYKYSYKPEKIFYGCSVVKIVDALYLLEQAADNKINLDTESVTYTKKFEKPYSKGLRNIQFGTKVPLRDLIKYDISVSDNSAHFMLVNYIGKNNLKEYAYNLGAKQIFSKDLYGNQTVTDTNIYLKTAYCIINEDKTYGPFLKSIMDNNYFNHLSTKDVKIYHKYGGCEDEYNDIGLYLGNHPYTISIFTKHFKGDYGKIVKSLHKKIIKLHEEFYKNRENTCKTLVYE